MPGAHVVLTGTMSLSLLGFPYLGTPTMIPVSPKESQ
jgi:hypothetical protein